MQDLNYHVRQVSFSNNCDLNEKLFIGIFGKLLLQVKHALTHFKDVIIKRKLEMLHGNGTVVLESIANVHTGKRKKEKSHKISYNIESNSFSQH